MAADPAGDGLRRLSSRDLDHGRHAVRDDAQTAETVVQGDVVGYQPEDGSKCSRIAASPRARQLRNRMVVASQLRLAMVRPGRDRLKGCVEVDET